MGRLQPKLVNFINNPEQRVRKWVSVSFKLSEVAIWPVTGQGLKTQNDRQSYILSESHKIEKFQLIYSKLSYVD